jgi:hypothetical protein
MLRVCEGERDPRGEAWEKGRMPSSMLEVSMAS